MIFERRIGAEIPPAANSMACGPRIGLVVRPEVVGPFSGIGQAR